MAKETKAAKGDKPEAAKAPKGAKSDAPKAAAAQAATPKD